MDTWLKPALAYVPDWLDMQMRASRQPGCIVAIAHHGRIVLEHALGSADLVPMGERVRVGNPFLDVGEITMSGRDKGHLSLTNGYSTHGEPVRRERDASGQVTAVYGSVAACCGRGHRSPPT
jgi:hypothetical protein